ncbi:MAG: EAL domain-containing protein [Burkholderiales bacterium]|nr:EAL domain-containing protein [Phycisphaerae bacterium]
MTNQKLLIIDDSEDIHDLVKVWLADEPIEFHSCLDGEDGLAQVPIVHPDLILLDVDLPGQDGFEVCSRLKGNPATADIPIVFLTGASSTDEKLHGLELGAIDYVTKPFDPAELRARVRAALNTKRLMDLLAQKALTLQESEERFRVLAENSSDAISRHNPQGVYLYASPACGAILSYSPDRLLGRAVTEFIHPDDADAVRACWVTPRSAGETGTVAFRFLRGDGNYVWLESTCRTLINPATGEIREIHASARDITPRKQMEDREQIRADVLEMIAQGRPLQEILRTLIEAAERQEPNASAAGVMLSEGIAYHCAPSLPPTIASSIEKQLYNLIARFGTLAAASSERIIVCDLMSDPAWAELRPAVEATGLRSCWSILIRSRQREAAGLFSLYRPDNARPHTSAVEMLKLASELTSVAVEHNQLTDQLTFQAQHDALTQLPNRALFKDRLEQVMAVAARTASSSAVLLIDVDRFKYVNDTYGHQAGDEMLCQVAHRLRARLRTCDTLARMGGDEFAVILGTLAHPDDAAIVAASLVDEFKSPIDLQNRKQFVTISIGSAAYPRDAQDPMTLLKNADLALYRAKDAGRNGAKPYTPDMGEGTAERMELEGALRQAVTNNELRLFYQPKVTVAGEIVGLEALLRWQHPTLGMIPPNKFIPLAEDTGIIVTIGKWVLEEAARQYHAWVAAGLRLVPISVNVSTMQFAQANFINTISEVLSSPDLPAGWLEIELTESLLMRNIRDAGEKLAHLRDLRVTVAIDDFGTGYSSLAYLERLSIDTLKIDHSFVSAIDPGNLGRLAPARTSGNGRTIIGAIVAMAKSMGLRVVAEGVETETQRAFLTEIGCDFLQGYLFSPPKSAQQLEHLLRERVIRPAQVFVEAA